MLPYSCVSDSPEELSSKPYRAVAALWLTYPVTLRQKQPMIHTINRKLEQTNADLINQVVFLVGLLVVIVSFFCPPWPDVKGTLLSVGCSLVAASIVTYLSSRYLARKSRIREIMDHWGLEAIYETRQKMNLGAEDAWDTVTQNLDAIGWGFRSMRDAKGSRVEAKIKSGMKVRFIVPSPESDTVRQREEEERKTKGSIKHEIEQLSVWATELNAMVPGSVEIRYYKGLPQDFYFRLDDVVFIGPYLYGKTSQQTISYEFHGPSHGFSHYRDYFDTLWADENFSSRPVTEMSRR